MASINAADLAHVPLFAGLSEPNLRIIASWFDVTDAPPGSQLTHEGGAGYAFSLLHTGTADVLVHGQVVRRLIAGDYFGELSMLGNGRQTATVKVTSPATVWTMFGTRFRELQRQHPDIAAAIERTAAERLA